MRVLLTGAGGFVGHHVLRHLLMNTDWHILCPMTSRHRGVVTRVQYARKDIPGADDRSEVFYHDLRMPWMDRELVALGDIDLVLNVASQSHVDRSIAAPVSFIENNVQLMLNVLELSRIVQPRMVMHMSTDEVYGPASPGHRHREGEPHRPSNPYSASKAAQEAIGFSYWRTYDVPLVITNTMNIFGEAQDPEKYMAKVMSLIQRGQSVPVHAKRYPIDVGVHTGQYPREYQPDGWKPGSRFYLHARNLADAWLFLITRELTHNDVLLKYDEGEPDLNRFNIVGDTEVDNLQFAHVIAQAMGKNNFEYEMVDFHTSRPGHDLRYALHGQRLANLGWKAPISFEDGIKRTVDWTLKHPVWL